MINELKKYIDELQKKQNEKYSKYAESLTVADNKLYTSNTSAEAIEFGLTTSILRDLRMIVGVEELRLSRTKCLEELGFKNVDELEYRLDISNEDFVEITLDIEKESYTVFNTTGEDYSITDELHKACMLEFGSIKRGSI